MSIRDKVLYKCILAIHFTQSVFLFIYRYIYFVKYIYTSIYILHVYLIAASSYHFIPFIP